MKVNSYLVQGEIVFIKKLQQDNRTFNFSIDIEIDWEPHLVLNHAELLVRKITKTALAQGKFVDLINRTGVKAFVFNNISLLDQFEKPKS